MIVGNQGILSAYGTGRGRIVIRGVAHIEELKGGRHQIIITEIPYQVNKASLIERIAELVRENRIDQISDLRDESDQRGMSIVIELKRGAQPKKVLNQLYKYTALQSTFGVQLLALVDGEPGTLPLKMALRIFIEHRQQVVVRRSTFELTKARERLHILDGYRIALAAEFINTAIETVVDLASPGKHPWAKVGKYVGAAAVLVAALAAILAGLLLLGPPFLVKLKPFFIDN